MNIRNKTVLITGANRGIGRALLDEALRRGAKKIYAATRGTFQHPDERVKPLTLDVTNASQIQRAVADVDTLDVLINNAGIAIYDDLSNFDTLEQSPRPRASSTGWKKARRKSSPIQRLNPSPKPGAPT